MDTNRHTDKHTHTRTRIAKLDESTCSFIKIGSKTDADTKRGHAEKRSKMMSIYRERERGSERERPHSMEMTLKG